MLDMYHAKRSDESPIKRRRKVVRSQVMKLSFSFIEMQIDFTAINSVIIVGVFPQ